MGGYVLGVDLGTTFTAAAVRTEGQNEILTLGDRSTTMPTVVTLDEGGSFLVGDAAERRATQWPERTARDFKRRLGDTTPILLGGSPFAPQALLAAVLADVLRRVTQERGEPPTRVALSHPANWGPYKQELVQQIATLAGLDPAQVVVITEPEAAAIHYVGRESLRPGSTVAVYDLGGGTFDASVLRVREGSFQILGEPQGIEHLGGIDFDAALDAHVRSMAGDALADLDPDDPATAQVAADLRVACTVAKEALSSDADAHVRVATPTGALDVRVLRSELEDMIRPAVAQTVDCLRRALHSAVMEPADIDSVLLVGGSSRIPLVAEMISAALGRPVALDAHPKHVVSLGAAAFATGITPAEAADEELLPVVVSDPVADEARRRRRVLVGVGAAVLALTATSISVALLGDRPDAVLADEVRHEQDADDGDRRDGGDGTATTGEGQPTSAPEVVDPTVTSVSILPDGGTTIIVQHLPEPGSSGSFGTSPTAAPPAGGGSSPTVATTARPPTTAGPTTTTTTTPAPPATPAATSPGTPTNVSVGGATATAFNNGEMSEIRVSLSWQAPSFTGNRALTGYRVYRTLMNRNGTTAGNRLLVGSPSGTTFQIASPTNGSQPASSWYRWEVVAVNAAGLESDPALPIAAVLDVRGQKEWDAYFLLRALGLSATGGGTSTSCSGSYTVCEQTPVSGPLHAGGSVTIRATGP